MNEKGNTIGNFDRYTEKKERLRKIAKQMYDICKANNCTLYEVHLVIEELKNIIKSTNLQ